VLTDGAEKTRIAGKVLHEVNCTPVPNAEADRFLSIRAEAALQPQKKVQMFNKISQDREVTNPNEWDAFLVCHLVLDLYLKCC